MRPRRGVLAIALALGVAALVCWCRQSTLVGVGARWYLARIAAGEQATGDLTRRRTVVAQVSRAVLMPPPPDGMVAELFELITQMSDRTARGEISLAWAGYIYTGYVRDLVRDRPDGTPARSPAEVRRALDRTVAFFSIARRPDTPGITTADVLGEGADSYTRDEIDEADRQGHPLEAR